MLKQLENYYRREGILSSDFRCKHLRECRGGMPLTPEDALDATGTFTCAKSAFVGDRYGAAKLPRLLFISSDPGSANTDVSPKTDEVLIAFAPSENRTPAAVQDLVMRRARYIREGKIRGYNSPRLRETNKLAMRILGAFNPKFAENVELTMQHYAHANAVKCCENNHGREEAKNTALSENCRGYLRGEINALAPDIVVTLGVPAKEGVAFAFSVKIPKWGCSQIIVPQSGGKIFWLPLYHPRYAAGFYSQICQRWEIWKKEIRAFMKANR